MTHGWMASYVKWCNYWQPGSGTAHHSYPERGGVMSTQSGNLSIFLPRPTLPPSHKLLPPYRCLPGRASVWLLPCVASLCSVRLTLCRHCWRETQLTLIATPVCTLEYQASSQCWPHVWISNMDIKLNPQEPQSAYG